MTVTKFAAPHLAPIAGLLEAVRTDLMTLGLAQYVIMVRPEPAYLRDLGIAVELAGNALEALAGVLPRQEQRPLKIRTEELRTVKTNIMAAVRKLELQ